VTIPFASYPNLAIWDDHDYGANNAGQEYPKKKQSRDIFLNFWKVPQDDPRRLHDGIYGAYMFGHGMETVHVILLDGRSFRSTSKGAAPGTMLGEEQWQWLELELLKPSNGVPYRCCACRLSAPKGLCSKTTTSSSLN